MKPVGYSILLLLLCGVWLQAQNLEVHQSMDFQALTVEDGLSQNSVNCILKDRLGYMWFGTRSGLNRFDSYQVLQVGGQDVELDQFVNSEISDLFEDQDGKIWIATSYGLYFYNPSNESITRSKFFPENISIICIEPEADSLFWLGTSEGLYLYHTETGIKEEFTHKPYQTNSLTNSIIYALENDDDVLWIGTAEGLNRYHKESRSFNQFLRSDRPHSIPDNRIRSLLKTEDGTIWIGTEYGGLSSLAPGSNHFSTLSTTNSNLPHNAIWDIYEGSSGDIWIATNGSGLCLLNPLTLEIILFQHDPSNPRSLSNNSVYSVLEDREGVLWAGTFAYGVNYASAKPGVFKYIYHQPSNPNSVCESKIRSVFLDSDSKLWMGTWGGLSMLDPQTGRFTSYASDKTNSRSLSFNTVTSVLEDAKGRIWVGTYSGGLNLLNDRGDGFTHFYHDDDDPSSLSSNQVYCIAEDMDENLWIATSSGLNKYLEETGEFEFFSNYDIRDIQIVDEENLILAIVGGVALFNIETNSFEFFQSDRLSTFQLNFVSNVIDDGIWFGTQGAGMGYLSLDGKQFKVYTIKDGLPSNHVTACVPVSDTVFWISTYKGLSRFNTNTEVFRNFGLADGLPGYEYFPRSGVQLADGQLAFGSSKGLVFFYPDSLEGLKYETEVLLSDLKINNNPVQIGIKGSPLDQSLSETDRIRLKHSEKDFMIDFVALNFKNPGKNNYAYRLDNYVDTWRKIGDTRSIGFTNLDRGEYIFRVRACNENEDPSKLAETTLAITILPPFWGTWWFRGLLLLVLTALFITYNKLSFISREQKRKLALQQMEYEKQEKFVNMKLRFFSNISHEFRTPLTLILDPLQKLIKMDSDVETRRLLVLMDKSSRRLLRLIDQILDFRKVETDALQLRVREIDMIALIRGIYDSFTEMATNNDIDYNLVCDTDSLKGWLDDDKIEKILYNILSNAFKFTPSGGKIIVKIFVNQLDDSFITFSVSDTGTGVSKEKLPFIFDRFYTDQRASTVSRAGAGIGLAMVKKMIELHRGSVEVESNKDRGTIFEFTLPVAAKYYTEEERIRYDVRDMENLMPQIGAKIEEPEQDAVGKERPLVMVVEDDKDIRDYLEQVLGDHFRIVTGSNGKEGLSLLDEHKPDLILSDTIMPEMNGIEMCEAIKANEDTALIPFLFLSVWSSDDFKLKGLFTGADDYITKPFNSDILIQKIKNTIEFRRKVAVLSNAKIDITPKEIHLDSMQTIFVNRVQSVLEDNISDPDFNSKLFREKMNMSHSLLYRNLKNLTGLSSNELIRDYRLKRAAQILKMDTGLSISEIGFKVGFVDSKYFSQCFKKKYDLTPSEYMQQVGPELNEGEEQYFNPLEQSDPSS